jgi:hypothetical protein
MIPDYWIKFLDKNSLRGVECEIPEDKDLSQLDGCCLEVFNEENILDEATNFYPGLIVKNDGYIPVAGCCHGSGDPYFININNGEFGPLYRIYHDEVHDENYDRSKAIEIVLENYQALLQYKST